MRRNGARVIQRVCHLLDGLGVSLDAVGILNPEIERVDVDRAARGVCKRYVYPDELVALLRPLGAARHEVVLNLVYREHPIV